MKPRGSLVIMKTFQRLAVAAGLCVITTSVGFAFTGNSQAVPPPPTAVGNHHVTCDTFVGAGKFSVPIDLVGGVPTTLTIKGTLDGCVDTDDAAVKLAPSKIAIVVNYSDNFATALATPQTVTATANISWKFDKTSVKTDLKTTQITWTQQPAPITNVTIPNLIGSYTVSQIPAGNMAIASGQAFTGGDAGVLSTSSQLLGQTTAALSGQLFDQGVVKGVAIGAGDFTIG